MSGGGAAERGGSGRGLAVNNAGAGLNHFQERFEPVHVYLDDLRVAGTKTICEDAKTGAVRVDNYGEVGHGVEDETMEAAEEAAGATHI